VAKQLLEHLEETAVVFKTERRVPGSQLIGRSSDVRSCGGSSGGTQVLRRKGLLRIY